MATKLPPGLKGKAVRKALILAFIEQYVKKNGRPPSQREIAIGIGMSETSWGTVSVYMKELVREGKLRRGDGARGFSLPPLPSSK